MSTSVVAFRGTSGRDARRFLCPDRTWEFLRDLGQTFGWHPTGTSYVTSVRQRMPHSLPVRHNYQPGGEQDRKQIDADDAIEWASALYTARHSSHFGGMIRAHAGLIDSPKETLLNLVDEFIDFAREGAFVFALAAETDAQLSVALEGSLK